MEDQTIIRILDEPQPCRLCGTSTRRAVHVVSDGTPESGPYAYDRAMCDPCGERIDALNAFEPPCRYCGADGDTLAPCCPEAEAEAAHYAEEAAYLESADEEPADWQGRRPANRPAHGADCEPSLSSKDRETIANFLQDHPCPGVTVSGRKGARRFGAMVK